MFCVLVLSELGQTQPRGTDFINRVGCVCVGRMGQEMGANRRGVGVNIKQNFYLVYTVLGPGI